jgi:enamine deaminase RidA (YjgF/YER057c/UK114 family)
LGILVLLSVVIPALLLPAQRRKKDEEEVTQTLEVLPDPPPAVIADVDRLVFHVAPLSAKGLLSQQTRDAIRALNRVLRGATAVKLRAFVAGTGDMRRVQSIVSEVYSERRQPLPALSVVQAGGLPLEGAQVVVESVAVARRPQNPQGLAFISGQAATDKDPLAPIGPLVDKSLTALKSAAAAVNPDPASVLRVTCFLTSLDQSMKIRGEILTAFPKAAVNLVQTQRAPASAIAECEAVARLAKAPAGKAELANPDGLPKSANYSQIALLGPGKVALSGTQLAFRYQDADIRLAFERLKKALEQVRARVEDTVMSSIYPLNAGMADRIRAIRFEFYDRARPPASTMLPFEGLPSLDASFGVDVVAVIP